MTNSKSAGKASAGPSRWGWVLSYSSAAPTGKSSPASSRGVRDSGALDSQAPGLEPCPCDLCSHCLKNTPGSVSSTGQAPWVLFLLVFLKKKYPQVKAVSLVLWPPEREDHLELPARQVIPVLYPRRSHAVATCGYLTSTVPRTEQ